MKAVILGIAFTTASLSPISPIRNRRQTRRRRKSEKRILEREIARRHVTVIACHPRHQAELTERPRLLSSV